MYLYLYIGVYFPSCTYTQDIQYVLRSAYKWVSGVKNGGRILCTIQTVVVVVELGLDGNLARELGSVH